jgi:hypothetical protein
VNANTGSFGQLLVSSTSQFSSSLYLSGSDNRLYGTASAAESASTALYAVTASYALNADGAGGLWTGSFGDGHIERVSNVHVSGTLFADAKSFDIGHPTKPGHRLRYGSLEGPEYGVYYRGKTRGNIIELPNYWYNLVDENTISVTLTPIGRYQSLYVVEATSRRIEIRNASWFDKRKPEYYYVVYGERKDIKKLNVEYKK